MPRAIVLAIGCATRDLPPDLLNGNQLSERGYSDAAGHELVCDLELGLRLLISGRFPDIATAAAPLVPPRTASDADLFIWHDNRGTLRLVLWETRKPVSVGDIGQRLQLDGGKGLRS